jgi:hypothetical protein
MREVAEVKRRATQQFFADGTSHERMPKFRPDGTQIDNEFEWQLEEAITLGMQVAKIMLTDDILEKRQLHTVSGHRTMLEFNLTVWRSGPIKDGMPAGPEMHITCDVVRRE